MKNLTKEQEKETSSIKCPTKGCPGEARRRKLPKIGVWCSLCGCEWSSFQAVIDYAESLKK